jgi:uncharacterized protein (TIGR03032 family)
MTHSSSRHTAEVTNLAAVNDRAQYVFDPSLLDFETQGAFWETLGSLGITLAVSREYEHFVLLLSVRDGCPLQSPLPLPHPSGIAVDPATGHLVVSSTRTPNLIFWFRALSEEDWKREIVPARTPHPDGTLYVPFRTTLLPGSLYIHEIAMIGGELFATITGHNFVARLDPMGGWERVWWPQILDESAKAFRENFFQLNGVAAGVRLEESYFTAFSDLTDGAKPWKLGYGPKEKGVVFSGASRAVIARGLTCPHSPRQRGADLWLCNSGFGELSCISDIAAGEGVARSVTRFDGFTRGLAFAGDLAFVGLSRVIASYEAYAPGVPPAQSCCGIVIVNIRTGAVVGQLVWPQGYQVFDIQILPGVRSGRFPFDPGNSGEINAYLRYLG